MQIFIRRFLFQMEALDLCLIGDDGAVYTATSSLYWIPWLPVFSGHIEKNCHAIWHDYCNQQCWFVDSATVKQQNQLMSCHQPVHDSQRLPGTLRKVGGCYSITTHTYYWH